VWQWFRKVTGGSKRETEADFILEREKLPRHVAIIMDGNGRWASNRGLPRTVGHQEGMESIRKVVKVCIEEKIQVLTLYAFSTENWQRPQAEVDFLMGLPQVYLDKELPELQRRNVKVCFLGRIKELSSNTRQVLADATMATKNNNALVLNICINYGGRAEIIDAFKTIVKQVEAGVITAEHITDQIVAQHLYTSEVGDPDLLIRTGGDTRVSNFLLWQIAYTELYFTNVLWPDFGEQEFKQALFSYQQRERRFGQIPGQNR
jgi:undecaprenyl diphosphate synthase